MSFLLPAESGEKVSLTITVLLSLAVYMLIIAEMLPPASNNFPIIGKSVFSRHTHWVSLTITFLLSFAVYLLILAEMLLPASNKFPIIDKSVSTRHTRWV